MTRVAVVGAAGRMGKTLIEALHNTGGLQLAAATEQPDSSLIGTDAGEVAGVGRCGVLVSHSLAKVVDDFDVVIDFTGPAATMVHLDVCRRHGKAMVIGTTGLDAAQKAKIAEAALAESKAARAKKKADKKADKKAPRIFWRGWYRNGSTSSDKPYRRFSTA